MNAHTHHGLLVSGGGHALVVALLLALGNFALPPRVEKPVGAMELVALRGTGAGEKEGWVEPGVAVPVPVRFQPPVVKIPVVAKMEPEVVEATEMTAAPIVPVRPRAVSSATVGPKSTPVSRVPKAVSLPRTPPPRMTPAVATTIPGVNVKELVDGLRPGPGPAVHGHERGRPPGDGDEALASYYQLIKQRVRAAFDSPARTTDGLVAGVAFRISGKGGVSEVRITRSSGDAAFDAAVLAAFARVRLPEKPDGRAEELELAFRTEDLAGR